MVTDKLTTLYLDWKLCLKRISYLKQKLSFMEDACTPCSCSSSSLPSSASALTGLLLSVSSLLLRRPAAFLSSLRFTDPQIWRNWWKKIMRKSDIVAFSHRGPVLHTNVHEAQRWGASLFAVLWWHRLYTKSDVAVSDLHLFILSVFPPWTSISI